MRVVGLLRVGCRPCKNACHHRRAHARNEAEATVSARGKTRSGVAGANTNRSGVANGTESFGGQIVCAVVRWSSNQKHIAVRVGCSQRVMRRRLESCTCRRSGTPPTERLCESFASNKRVFAFKGWDSCGPSSSVLRNNPEAMVWLGRFQRAVVARVILLVTYVGSASDDNVTSDGKYVLE